jgi:hypothetical protein
MKSGKRRKLTARSSSGFTMSIRTNSCTVPTLLRLSFLWNAPSLPIFSSLQTSSARTGG